MIQTRLCTQWKPAIYGMIHLLPTPGAPLWKGGSVSKTIEKATAEAEIYKKYNFSGVIVENMHDLPYLKAAQIEPQTVTTMTVVAHEVRKILPRSGNFQIGIQTLSGANKDSLAISLAADCDFIRAEGFVYGHLGDEGLMESCAGELLRYRNRIGAQNIRIYCDIQKKHCSHSITGDLTIEDHAKAAEFFAADGVILTGKMTGEATDPKLTGLLKAKTSLPILIGSGIDTQNLPQFRGSDGVIVGSSLKQNGYWMNSLDEDKVSEFIEAAAKINCKRADA